MRVRARAAAFPHNAELENTSPTMLQLGLEATQALDASVGAPRKRSLSQRDVPGMPRSAIPLLKKEGVELITVGVNGASMYPRVPKLFRWRDPISAEEVLAMWHPRGYGGYTVGEAVTLAGFEEALVTAWNGDNQGVYDAHEYIAIFEQVQAEFPNATVVASTFDDWLSAVEGSGLRSTLPVVEKEVGDSWIYGGACGGGGRGLQGRDGDRANRDPASGGRQPRAEGMSRAFESRATQSPRTRRRSHNPARSTGRSRGTSSLAGHVMRHCATSVGWRSRIASTLGVAT